nr:MFS transporter [Streptomyces sp. SID3343]
MCLGLFILGVDFTVLNVAVPDLQRDMRPSMAQVQWIIDGYALVLGGCVLAAGAVSDAYGRRRCFLVGLWLCAMACLVGASAHAPWELIAARCGMGAGAALMMPSTLSVIVSLFPEGPQRRKAVSLWALVAGAGTLLGPVAGGYLVEHYSWRAGFWAPIPCVLVTMAAAAVVVPESRGLRNEPIDLTGMGWSTAGFLALVWAIIEGPDRGWTTAPILGAFAAAIVLLAAFARHQRRCAAPMLPIDVLKDTRMRTATAVLAMLSFAVFGALFVLSLYLQNILHLSAAQAGQRMLPLSAAMAVGVAGAFVVSRRCSQRALVTAGLLAVFCGFAVLAGAGPGSGYGRVLLFELLAGLGVGIAAPTATEAVMGCLPADRTGAGSAINDATRQIGSAVGVAVQGSILTSVHADRMRAFPTPPGADVGVHSLMSTAASTPRLPPEVRARLVAHSQDAFVAGVASAAHAAMLVTALAAVAAWRRLGGRDSGVPTSAAPTEPVHGPALTTPSPSST